MPFRKGQSGNPAGRPRKTEKFARPIARAEKQIVDKLPEIIAAQLELALGVKVEELSATTGEPTVYQRPPDRAAAQYLIDRILGKPTERQELTGADGASLAVTTITEVIVERPVHTPE